MRRAAFAIPGDLATLTGGYAYDRRVIAELQNLSWQIDVVGLGDGFPNPTPAQVSYAMAALRLLPERMPVIVDGLALGALGGAVAQLSLRQPLLALVHHPLALETGLTQARADTLRKSERDALSFARHVFVTSPTTATVLAQDYAVASSRITVAYPGFDRALFTQGSSDGAIRLLAVGAIVPRKAFDVLIAALATLRDLPWSLTIVGDRTRDVATADALLQQISAAGLGNHVHLTGAVPEATLASHYAAADVFVLPSHYEGYGMAFAEALAYGLPVIGTKAGAIPDTVPRAAGILVPPGDVEALADALRIMMTERHKREAFRDAARVASQALPQWRDAAAQFAAVLERCI